MNLVSKLYKYIKKKFMNNVNFGMDGLSLDNTTWYNPKTGDSFKVRSNFFENNEMILQAYDGRSFNLKNMNDYVQYTSKTPPPRPESKQEPIPDEVLNLINNESPDRESYMLPEDEVLINKSSLTSTRSIPLSTSVSKAPSNIDIIYRALSKSALPKSSITLDWKKFPKREIEMLRDVMDIPVEEISNYYINIMTEDIQDLVSDLRSQISSHIEQSLKKESTNAKLPKKTQPNKRRTSTAGHI